MSDERTRIVLVDVHRLAAQIIEQAAAEHPSISIVAHVARPAALVEAVERSEAEFVITAVDDEAEVTALLREHPNIRVLAVTDDEREMFLYELRPHKRRLGELSPRRLLQILTEAAEQDRFEVVTC